MTQPAFPALFSDKRLWLFLLSGALAVVLGFFAIPGTAAINLLSKTGYWFELVAFILFLRALWLTFRDDLRALHWRRVDWASVLVVALAGIILLVHETFGFKIIMDELMLLGTSMSMHFDRLVLTPTRGNDIQGAFVILDGIMDKRPLFFPFLLSLLHDLTGYRPANAFVLNGILTFILLGLTYTCGRMLGGRRAGWLGVLLLAGLPLLGQNATGGGFELLNIVMIIATLLLGARFVQKRDEASLSALCLSTLLLGQVRYESLIYLLPVTILILWVWYGERRVILSWPVIFAPLLLLPCPLQHHIFELRTTAWQMGREVGDYSNATVPFSLSYVPDNIYHALKFFFARPTDQPNSLTLSILGWFAVGFFLLFAAKSLRTLRTQPPAVVASVIFTVGFVIQLVLFMGYFWGQFDAVIIRRLSLPTHLWLVVAVMTILPQFAAGFQRFLIGVAVFGLIASGVPSMAEHAYSQEYLPGKETAWRRQFMADQPRHDYLMIDNDAILWVSHLVSATTVPRAIQRRDDIAATLRNHVFSDIFVFQRYAVSDSTGKMTLRAGDDLGPDFVLETVREERLQTYFLDRISRIKEVRHGSTSLTAPDKGPPPVVTQNRAEIEKMRKAYLENFIKQLP